MNKSKVDRAAEFFSLRLRAAIESSRLELHHQGKHEAAALLNEFEQRLCARMQWMDVYDRLELSDIIKGHKRAWPET